VRNLDVVAIQYRALVARMAINSWWKYPPTVRWHMDVEDMIQDGLLFVRYVALPGYDRKKRAFPFRYLQKCLTGFFSNMAEYHYAKIRYEGRTIQIEDLRILGEEPSEEVEYCNGIHVHVVRAFTNVYFSASEPLRQSMTRWFLGRKHGSTQGIRIHRNTVRFQNDRREFLALAHKYNLDRTDCEVILGSSKCRKDILDKLPENVVVGLEMFDPEEFPVSVLRQV